jgi:hypothetical protein
MRSPGFEIIEKINTRAMVAIPPTIGSLRKDVGWYRM